MPLSHLLTPGRRGVFQHRAGHPLGVQGGSECPCLCPLGLPASALGAVLWGRSGEPCVPGAASPPPRRGHQLSLRPARMSALLFVCVLFSSRICHGPSGFSAGGQPHGAPSLPLRPLSPSLGLDGGRSFSPRRAAPGPPPPHPSLRGRQAPRESAGPGSRNPSRSARCLRLCSPLTAARPQPPAWRPDGSASSQTAKHLGVS